MKRDKDIQMEILQAAQNAAPRGITLVKPDDQHIRVAQYLIGHGLIRANTMPHSHGIAVGRITITEKGVDYLSEDGGLTAELGTITVKLHEDTIRALLSARIAAADLLAEEKATLQAQIKDLSGQALSQLTARLVGMLLDASGQGWGLIYKALGELLR